jgi:hypothetical protein
MAQYFVVQHDPDDANASVYVVDGQRFGPLGHTGSMQLIDEGLTFEQSVEAHGLRWHITPCLPPRHFHPQIYRPLWAAPRPLFSNYSLNAEPEPPPVDLASFASCIGMLSALSDELRAIFRVIEPVETNFSAYGHAMRNLLILACTEVEANCRRILKANDALPACPTTRDYVKLLNPLKLAQYGLTLPLFPKAGTVHPFLGWDMRESTKSLQWYDSYNAVKHDREGKPEQANLLHALTAVAAVAALAEAQFGPQQHWREHPRMLFSIEPPRFAPHERYISTYPFFDPPKTWTAVPAPFA